MNLLRRIWEALPKAPVMTATGATLFLAFLVLGVLIGLPPFGYVVITVLVAAPSLWFLLRAVTAAEQNGAKVSDGRAVGVLFASILGTIVVIQAIPYGWDRSNPPVLAEPNWAGDAASAQGQRTRELMVRACFGCHSNEVEYPWYSRVAPISWTVASHVSEGREQVNYSEFVEGSRRYRETIEVIREGSMPPGYFTRFGRHPEAKLTRAETDELIAGLRLTPGLEEGRDGRRDGDEDGDED